MKDETKISRKRMIELLNEDLAREYQAIIAYIIYSQTLKGARIQPHRAGTGKTCRRRIAARPSDRQADRLLQWRADEQAEGSESVR